MYTSSSGVNYRALSGLLDAGIIVQNVARDTSRADSGFRASVGGTISDGLDTDFTVVGAVKNVAGNTAGTEGLSNSFASGGVEDILNDNGLAVGNRLRGTLGASVGDSIVRKSGGTYCAFVGVG